jgi:hypothetical protein
MYMILLAITALFSLPGKNTLVSSGKDANNTSGRTSEVLEFNYVTSSDNRIACNRVKNTP